MDKLTIPVSSADVSAAMDPSGLARLKAAAASQSPEALKQVAQQFEALFLDMMLKSMRDASLGDGIFDNDASQMYTQMFDKQIAQQMAKSGGKGLGIAEILTRQLSKQIAPAAKEGASAEGAALPIQKPVAPLPIDQGPAAPLPIDRQPDAAPMPIEWKPATPAEFIREVLPHAQKAAAALGVHPLALVAQAAVETGWGQHVITGNDGANSLNLFGIKAGEAWSGDKAVARTIEFKDGLPNAQQASFRRYGTIAESFNDYVKVLSNSPRYREVLAQGQDLQGFADAMGRSGYATDPDYASKIKGVMSGGTMREALSSLMRESVARLQAGPGLKTPESGPMT